MSEIDRYGLEQYADVLWPMDEGRLVFYDDHLAAVAKLEAEVARLRGALEIIASDCTDQSCLEDTEQWTERERVGWCQSCYAREALAGEGEEFDALP